MIPSFDNHEMGLPFARLYMAVCTRSELATSHEFLPLRARVVELVQVSRVPGVQEFSSTPGISTEPAQEILREPLELSGIG